MQSLLLFLPFLLIVGISILLIVKFLPSKGRSIGVTVFSVWLIIQGISALQFRPMIGIFAFAIVAYFIVIAIGIAKLYNPARIAVLITYALISFILAINIVISTINKEGPSIISNQFVTLCASLIYLGGIIFFLTRPNIKKQFGNESLGEINQYEK